MTTEETKNLLTVLKTNYPNSFKISLQDSKQMVALWAEAFKNENVQDVITAVKKIIYEDTREFAPNIAQVKSRIVRSNVLSNDVIKNENELLELISQGNEEAKKQFEMLNGDYETWHTNLLKKLNEQIERLKNERTRY